MTDEITRNAALKATPLVWFDHIVVDLFRQFRVSFIPPLMVYLAAGISGLTAIVGTFFVKEYLGLSASYLAGLAFWAGLPWTLKIPLGHLVDLWWRRKEWLVYLGVLLIACGLLIMIGLVLHTDAMRAVMPVEYWYVLSVLLAPTGYVVQDVVADAMTVEAVSTTDEQGQPIDDEQIKRQHTTMQTLGRIAIIGGSLLVAGVNVIYFDNMDTMSVAMRAETYGFIYQLALLIPVVSVAGVTLGKVITNRKIRSFRQMGFDASDALTMVHGKREETEANWWLFGGSIVFVVFTVGVGLSNVSGSQEVVFVGAMAIVIFLMHRLLLELPPATRRELIGTAVIIFIFRAIPGPGAGLTWFEIDELGFDQQFLAVLSMLTSTLTLVGMLVLRPLMATRSIAWVVVVLSLAFGLLSLPNIGLFYGVHHWTASWSQGLIDARTIALMDTMLESPLGQIAMIPMLAWIARSAPAHLKATFFAVMASFTNLALSASSLGTRYLNEWRTVTREVRDSASNAVTVAADYGELGLLLISVAVIGLLVPLLAVGLVQASPWRTRS
jgi:hypothetical protein